MFADVIGALSPAALGIAAGGVFLGTIVQRLSGQGFGMIAAPMLAIVAPEFLPVTLLLMGVFVGMSAAALEVSAITRGDLLPGISGRTLGAVVAAFIALSLPDARMLAFIIAGAVFLAIALSLAGLRVPINGRTLFGAGFTAGIMGTLTAIGAPPMALLYQHEPQRRAVAMQNVFFFVGMVVSLIALAAVGLFGIKHLAFAVLLAPASIAGMLLAQRLAPRVARAQMRPYALALSGLAAFVLLIKQFT
ncbi:MAG: putative membrane protein YfcA [Halocynthiibacter sp.]|jgi:uncharacterized membrane protein YfcA